MCEDLITKSTIRNLYRMVKPYVLKNCGSMQDVEDVLQDGLYKFLNVYNKNGFEPEHKLENYIFSICRNCWLKEIKKKGKFKLNRNLLVEDIEDNEWELKTKQRKKLLSEIFERSLALLGDKVRNSPEILPPYIHQLSKLVGLPG